MSKSIWLIFGLTLVAKAHGATLLYEQGFEDPIGDSPEISWEVAGRPTSQAIVTHDPKAGSRSVRGNFNSDVIDPITNIRGYANVHFDIHLKKVPQLAEWIDSTNEIYVSWWFKLDKCHWKGRDFQNEDPLKLSAKFAYLAMNQNSETSYYLNARGGDTGVGSIGVNLASWMVLWEDLYERATIWGSSGSSYGTDGEWHQLSFFINRDVEGRQFIRWWIDGKLMKSDRADNEGKVRIVDEYTFDTIGFWHSKQALVDQSEELSVANYCSGWQIDEVQVWDGIPSRPMPPTIR